MTSDEKDRFLARERDGVIAWLKSNGVSHGGVADHPAWSLAPTISVWLVRDLETPSLPKWFAIAGDGPIDYVAWEATRDARSAVKHFSKLWLEVADAMEKGVAHPECRIGTPDQWPAMHAMVRARAQRLAGYAADAELWTATAVR